MNIRNLFFIVLFFSLFKITAQEHQFGLKAGGNLAKFTDASGNDYRFRNRGDFKFKPGFYAGAFYAFRSGNYQFQPEVLFGLQGSKVVKDDLSVPAFDYYGNPISSSTYEYKYSIHELSILVPLMSRFHVTNGLFFEAGPQFAFIVDRNLQSDYQVIEGESDNFIMRDGDSFDAGLNLGVGHHINKTILVNFRTYFGAIKRENEIRGIVLNLGVEYRIW